MRPLRIEFAGILGQCAQREVFLGFAPAKALANASFADVLDEESGRGYQRRPNPQHSLDFSRYIQRPGSATIPLTFNARPRTDDAWTLSRNPPAAELALRLENGPVLARVDCQHRLGHIQDLEISLPFMCFLGLSEREEMEIFSVINGKAKGLSTSLLDFHAATLATDLGAERPELLIALQLNNAPGSPWHRQLDLGGQKTSGLYRRASLRTMQQAAKRFLNHSRVLATASPMRAAEIALSFWAAVSQLMEGAWANPRRHLLTKGVGVYSLMILAADLVQEARDPDMCDRAYFARELAYVLPYLDWTTNGDLQGFGGEAGVKQAIALLRSTRAKQRLKVIDVAQ